MRVSPVEFAAHAPGRFVHGSCEEQVSPAKRGSGGQWGVAGWQGVAGLRPSRRWRGMGRSGWGCARRRRSAVFRYGSYQSPNGNAPIFTRTPAHSQCTWGLSAELSVFASSKLKCQCTLCPALSVQNTPLYIMIKCRSATLTLSASASWISTLEAQCQCCTCTTCAMTHRFELCRDPG